MNPKNPADNIKGGFIPSIIVIYYTYNGEMWFVILWGVFFFFFLGFQNSFYELSFY